MVSAAGGSYALWKAYAQRPATDIYFVSAIVERFASAIILNQCQL